MEKPLGLYLHIPFCKSKCAYCDFYSLPHSEEKMDAYTAALIRHLEEVAPRCAAHQKRQHHVFPHRGSGVDALEIFLIFLR